MPAILKKEDEKKWINSSISKVESMDILQPFDENEMDAYTISKLITAKDKNPNVPQVIEPFTYNNLEPISNQRTLF